MGPNRKVFIAGLLFRVCLLCGTVEQQSQYGKKMKNHGRNNDMSPTDIVKKLLVSYDKNEAPSNKDPTVVKIGIYINSIYSINEQTMDYSVNMYLRQTWLDSRLSYYHLTNSTSLDRFRMPTYGWNTIWIPDTFFRNEKAADFHKVTVPNRFLRLSRDGTVWYVIKISAVFACPMSLQYYPLDSQSCSIMFESFGYTTDTITFGWLGNPVEFPKDMQLPQYAIGTPQLKDCTQNYAAGNFSCLEILFTLQREIGYFLIQVYIPSMLIVILSWVSFWIHVDASPARVSIGLLTVLTTTTMSAGARATLPRVSYIKALDVWMIACLVFVFASLIEYAIVNVLARRKASPKPPEGEAAEARSAKTEKGQERIVPRKDRSRSVVPMTTNTKIQLQPKGITTNMTKFGSVAEQGRRSEQVEFLEVHRDIEANLPQPAEPSRTRKFLANVLRRVLAFIWVDQATSDGKAKARKVDKISRKVFPISFLLFNLTYWIVYSSHNKST